MRERAPLGQAARSARRLGVLGGSFDPPHLGHLHAARSALEAFELDHVVLVPAGRPPHKPTHRLAAAEERLAMLALLLEGESRASVWGLELDRPGPSYTLDTLLELRARLASGARLYLVLGEDSLEGFATWRGAQEIVALAQPIVVQRRGAALPAGALSSFSGEARTRLELGILDVQPIDASSSALRERLARGAPAGDCLPPRLQDYLEKRGLYRPAAPRA